MKWENPKTELDAKAEVIVESFKKKKRIALFGAGKTGTELKEKLDYYNIFDGFIDNDTIKQKEGQKGTEVYSLEQYLKEHHGWIVIATGEEKYAVIGAQLKQKGLEEHIDFWNAGEFIDDIFPILSFFFFNKLYVDLVQISVTERCTLRCEKCAHACQNVDYAASDMSMDIVKKSADYFFEYADVAGEFVLIGGEPLLYQELTEAVRYIGEQYRDRMIMFSITTNGTIIPDEQLVEACKKYDVTIRVSDYSNTIPKLQKRYEQLYERLKDLNVAIWKTEKENSWFDYGFETVDRGSRPEALIVTFDQCRTHCREIRGSRYYYCVMARSVSENLGLGIGKDDYLELENLKDKKIFFEFQQGFSTKGYLEMCRHCRGAEAKNYLIPAAKQGETR